MFMLFLWAWFECIFLCLALGNNSAYASKFLLVFGVVVNVTNANLDTHA